MSNFVFLLLLISLFQCINCKISDWLYYPEVEGKAEFGIVMAATKSYFVRTPGVISQPDALYSSCMFHLYARKHGYAFYLNRDLGSINTRKYGECSSESMSPWNKIILARQLLPDVQYLVWIDIDAILDETSFSKPLTLFLPSLPLKSQYECLPRYQNFKSIAQYGELLKRFSLHELPGSDKYPFFFAVEDISTSYAVNINTAIFAIRNVPLAFEFLDDVWKVGDNHEYFKSIDTGWNKKFPCLGYWGWPWEQGGVWLTLAKHASKYLGGSCILSRSNKYVLNNINGDPALGALYADLSPEPEQIIFGYHHASISGRYILRRLIRTGLTTSPLINATCGIFVAPLFNSKVNQKQNQKLNQQIKKTQTNHGENKITTRAN